ncbi:MAE_28990/MAE_18760 family HEPN-like nuclease [Crossiella sp. NPDC003009]
MDIESLADSLERALAHRKRELSHVKTTLQEGVANEGEVGWITRTAVALSYAHWEGFVKTSSIKYIKLINSQSLRIYMLKEPLQAGCLTGHFRRAWSSSKSCHLGAVLTAIDARRREIFSVNPNKFVDTESNLSSVVFRELIMGIGLDYLDAYSMRHAFIDEQLVRARNQIVHGELVEFTPEQAVGRIDGVLYMLKLFFDHLLDSARDRAYLIG